MPDLQIILSRESQLQQQRPLWAAVNPVSNQADKKHQAVQHKNQSFGAISMSR